MEEAEEEATTERVQHGKLASADSEEQTSLFSCSVN